MKKPYFIATMIVGLLVITGCDVQSKPSELSQQSPGESKGKVESAAPTTVPAPPSELKQTDGAPPVSTNTSDNNGKAADAAKTLTITEPEGNKQKETMSPLKEEPKKAENTGEVNTGNKAEAPSEGSQAQPAKQEDSAAVTVETVKGKYNGQLLQLKDYYVGKLQTQLNQATQAKKSGQSNTELFNSYSQQIGTLHEESQAKLNQILLQMKNELLEKSLPTDSVNEFRATFYTEVDKTRESFTEQAKSQLVK
ncbi:hypothetical protein [Paenibacillus radicis (ex Xue et al. 2023)]|uniref:Lipoprotein n=1 Tax=Paenibacillus radicis (ex Xue et al. 2023) TaxID=2972489 RepID=A0ABT1YI68_9BACL|nr:hypothetical protein [Paenibacillus radicis (ex Xue et al. 2023)]MCR8632420.1 hypothetical protein [Paenibacillus radicis (ex Xue et al. 2023)]